MSYPDHLNSNQVWILDNLLEDIKEYIQDNNGNQFTRCPECDGLMVRTWYCRDFGGKQDIYNCQDCDNEIRCHPRANSAPDYVSKSTVQEVLAQ